MLALEREMAAAIAAAPIEGRYAAAVTDLQTGETVGVNEERLQLTACVANLFVLMLTMRDVQEGAPMDDVSDLMDTTIWGSDAFAARLLYEIAGDDDSLEGVRRVGELVDELGLDQTTIDHPPNYAWESTGVSDDNWTTALDMNRALWALYHGEILEEPYRSDLLERLTNVKPGLNYLLAYGTDGLVSHKNGFFEINDGTWVDNDVAIVRFDRGGEEYAYAISFFSDFVEEKYGDIPVGQEISQLAWVYFDAKYPE